MIQIDIPMPKGCWSCPYFKRDWAVPLCGAKSQKGRKLSRTWNLDDVRQKWCPIKEVKSEIHN